MPKKSGSGAGGAARRRILGECESQDPFRLNRFRRAGDVVKRASAESPHVSVPIGQVRNHDYRGAPGGRSQNAHRSAEIAIRQIVAAQHKLKRLFLNAAACVRQGSAMDGLQPQAASDFVGLLTLQGIGRYDQHLAGVKQFSPPSDRISSAQAKQLCPVEIILSSGPVATSSSRYSTEYSMNAEQSTRLVPVVSDGRDSRWSESANHAWSDWRGRYRNWVFARARKRPD